MKIVALAGRMGTGKDSVADVLQGHGWIRIALADSFKRIAARVFDLDRLTLFGPSRYRARTLTLSRQAWRRVYYNAGVCMPVVAAGFSGCGVEYSLIEREFLRFIDRCGARDSAAARLKSLLGLGDSLTVRWILQQLGTEFGRALHESVWTNCLLSSLEAIQGGCAYDPMLGAVISRTPPIDAVIVTDVRFRSEAERLVERGASVYWIDASKRVPNVAATHASEPDQSVFDGLLQGVIDNNGTREELAKRVEALFATAAHDGAEQ